MEIVTWLVVYAVVAFIWYRNGLVRGEVKGREEAAAVYVPLLNRATEREAEYNDMLRKALKRIEELRCEGEEWKNR